MIKMCCAKKPMLMSAIDTGSRYAPVLLILIYLLLISHMVKGAMRTPQQPEQSSNVPAHHQEPGTVDGQHHGGNRVKVEIPDVAVYDQDGKKIRFCTDLMKGKVVAINFVFTTCTYICPILGQTFSDLQAALGERLGRDVFLISVSTDPTTDTPERLKTWGARFGAKAGWTLVTGDKQEMDKLLRVFTGDPARKGEHFPIVFVGNYDRGAWIQTYGLGAPERYIKLFNDVVNTTNEPKQR